jgi:flagellar basal body-associated protein FliL
MTAKKMDKHGDVTITILVMGVLLLCTLAVFSFIFSDKLVQGSFDSIGTVEKASLIREKITFYEDLGYEKDKIKTILSLQEDARGNVVVTQFDVVTVRFPWP